MKKKNKKAAPEKTLKLGPPTTHGEFLEICINLTKKAIDDPSVGDGSGMKEQLERMSKELKQWRKNETKS